MYNIEEQPLIEIINSLINSGNFPRFNIIRGARGSGKTLISKYIAEELKCRYVTVENKIDGIRECIKLSYQQTSPTLYYIPNADKMSLGAKNALLKVTEEPPQKSYFIIEVTDLQNMLGTLISRANILNLFPYNPNFLKSYYIENLGGQKNDSVYDIIPYCSSIGELEMILEQNVDTEGLKKLCLKIVEHLSEASGANSLKITQSLRYKTYEEEPDKFDILLFMNGVTSELINKMDNPLEDNMNIRFYAEGVKITSKYKSELSVTGINKLATMDMWILELRKCLRGVYNGTY